MTAKQPHSRPAVDIATRIARVADSLHPVQATAIWLVMLAATMPATVQGGGWLVPDPWSSFSRVASLLLCAGAILAFALFCRRRRLTLFIFLGPVVTLQLVTEAIGWDRLLLLVSSIIVVTVLVEAVRQNRALFLELRARKADMGRLVRRTLYLWSPLLLIVFLGVLANRWLIETSENLIYEAEEFDRYCAPDDLVRAGQGEAAAIPCTRMNGREIRIPKCKEQGGSEIPCVKDLGPGESFRIHIEQSYSDARTAILGDAQCPELDPASNAAICSARSDSPELELWIKELAPTEVLGLDVLRESQAQEKERHEEMQRLEGEIRALRADLVRLRSRLESARRFRKNHPFRSLRRSFRREFRFNIDKEKELRRHLLRLRDQFRRLAPSRDPLETALFLLLKNESDADRRNVWRALLFVETGSKSQREVLLKQLKKNTKEQPHHRADAALRLLEADEKRLKHLWKYIQSRDKEGKAPGAEEGKAPRAEEGKAPGAERLCTVEGESKIMPAQNGIPVHFPCPNKEDKDEILLLTSLSLVESARLSVTRWRAEQAANIDTVISEGIEECRSETTAAVAEAKRWSEHVPANINLGRKRKCNLLHPLNCIFNILKKKAEGFYRRTRADLGAEFQENLGSAAQRFGSSCTGQIVAVHHEVNVFLDNVASSLRASIDRLEQSGKAASLLVTLFLVLAVIKSLLYVLATEIFDCDEIACVDFECRGAVEGQYVIGPHLKIPSTFRRPMLTKAVLDNQEIDKVVLYKATSAPLSRIRRGSYFVLNRGSHRRRGGKEMHFSRARGEQIVDWQMRAGEEVVFDYRNFFGASDNIELRTTISLRLATILLSGPILHSAYCREGDGHLILTISGLVDPNPDEIESTTRERLVAWNKHARFKISSKRTVKSVFIDGYTIVPVRVAGAPSGLILVEAVGDQRTSIAGTIRFVRTLLMPF